MIGRRRWKLGVAALLLAAVAAAVAAMPDIVDRPSCDAVARSAIPPGWLTNRRDVSDLDKVWSHGELSGQWRALKSQMKAGDELWDFVSPLVVGGPDHAARPDMQGIVLVRCGTPIATMVTFRGSPR